MGAPRQKRNARPAAPPRKASGTGRWGGSQALIVPAIDYRGLFEHAPDAVLVMDAQGRYIDANEAACALTGYTRAELLELRIGDLTIPSQRTYSERRFKLLRNTVVRLDMTWRRRAGQRKVKGQGQNVRRNPGVNDRAARGRQTDRLEARSSCLMDIQGTTPPSGHE